MGKVGLVVNVDGRGISRMLLLQRMTPFSKGIAVLFGHFGDARVSRLLVDLVNAQFIRLSLVFFGDLQSLPPFLGRFGSPLAAVIPGSLLLLADPHAVSRTYQRQLPAA